MKTFPTKTKKGFTIIEVSLVLAIGGLIMLMVFIAWPAVQRNQRDSQRRTSDLPRLATSISKYSSNNKGAIPTSATPATQNNVFVVGDEVGASLEEGQTLKGDANWTNFYNNYILVGGDVFEDPAGNRYNLNIVTCSGASGANFNKPNSGISADTACNHATTVPADGVSDYQGEQLLSSGGQIAADFQTQSNYITVVIGAYCDGETAKAATGGSGGNRKYAVMYTLEAGGTYCQSN